MGIQFTNSKSLNNNELIEAVLVEIKNDINLFVYIARVFDLVKQNGKSERDKVKRVIKHQLAIPKTSDQTRENLTKILTEIYDHPNFNKIRSGILEHVVYQYGPFSAGLIRDKCYIEPKVWDHIKGDSVLIGDLERRCDFVFYTDDKVPLEFIECKSNIGSVIPKFQAFDDERYIRKDDRNKVLYLTQVYHYLAANYTNPFIYFACYNVDYSDQLRNVQQNWGFSFLRFINPVEIVQDINNRALA